MKRSLLAVASAALLLAGCATGDTGHLDPEIDPDLMEIRSSPNPDQSSGGSDDEEESEPVETPAPGTSAAPSNDVEAAFSEAAGSQPWFTEVTAVDTDGDTVVVTTRLEPGDVDAVAVCEAAVGAAESAGVLSPSVDVRAVDGATISKLDLAAGDQGCANVG